MVAGTQSHSSANLLPFDLSDQSKNIISLVRPCSACAKKGYTVDQCTDGCDPCRRARVRCEDGISKPCRRCQEMKIECIDGPTISVYQSGHSEGSEGPTRMSPKNLRGSTGSLPTYDTNTVADASGNSAAIPGTLARSAGARGSKNTERAKLACASCRRDNKKVGALFFWLC